jgi:hypothetical protein
MTALVQFPCAMAAKEAARAAVAREAHALRAVDHQAQVVPGCAAP